jgi:predicted O-methyltransferase YrrM
VTVGGSSLPEVQRLLSVLAAGRRCAEAGTAFGEGASAMARTARSVVTVERDPDRARQARERLVACTNVELLEGDWQEVLPPHGQFDLLFLDAGGIKHHPEEHLPHAVALLVAHGQLLLDDFTPAAQPPVREADWGKGSGETGRFPRWDPARQAIFSHPELVAVEILTTPQTAAILATRETTA